MPLMGALCIASYPSPLGPLTLASEGERLVGLWFEGQRHYGARWPLASARVGWAPPLRAAFAWLESYFAGARPSPSALPLALVGTPFRLAVWRLLLRLPYGSVTTYGALAQSLRSSGLAASPRAVGGAVGHNPISIIIPCHRVVVAARAASLQYAAGAQRKLALLRHEQGAPLPSPHLPSHQSPIIHNA